MKLLVVSHACVLPINQNFFAMVQELSGWSVSLVVPALWRNEYTSEILPQRSESFKGTLRAVPIWRRGSVPAHVYKTFFGGILREEKPDVIYVHHEPYGFATFQVYLANALGRNVPIGFYAAQNISKQYPAPIAQLERAVLARSSFCFPVTEGALDVLRAKGYRGLAEVLPLAVDSHIYHRKQEAATQIRERLGIPADELVIGYIGRLVREKGLLTLLHALTEMRNRAWRCVLVGSGDLEPELRTEIQRLDLGERVTLTGYVPHAEAPEWLSFFDVLVLPSETQGNWKEQFGRVLVEANACGTAVIGTDCGEIPTVIGKTCGGVVVPEKNAGQLALSLLKLLGNPVTRLQLAEQGRQSVLRDYEQSHLAAKFVTIIQQTVQRKITS